MPWQNIEENMEESAKGEEWKSLFPKIQRHTSCLYSLIDPRSNYFIITVTMVGRALASLRSSLLAVLCKSRLTGG